MTELLSNGPEPLITSSEVERLLGMAPGFCAKDRLTRRLIPWVSVGKAIRYRVSDVQKFIEESIRSTSSNSGKRAA